MCALAAVLRSNGNLVAAEEFLREAWSRGRLALTDGDNNRTTIFALIRLVKLLISKVRQYFSYSTPWVYVIPYPGCSLTHFLRSVNRLSRSLIPRALSYISRALYLISRALPISCSLSLILCYVTHLVLPHAYCAPSRISRRKIHYPLAGVLKPLQGDIDGAKPLMAILPTGQLHLVQRSWP